MDGFIVQNDCWVAYFSACKELNVVHKTVNPILNFKKPIDETNTNTVEGQNNAIKIFINLENGQKNINYYLLFFCRTHKIRKMFRWMSE